MFGRTNALGGGGIDVSRKPDIDFDGKWSGWHIEVYDGKPYWEALFASSGTLTNYDGEYTCDVWGIGGGGHGGLKDNGYGGQGTGAGSGFTNMVENITLPSKTSAITIGAGATTHTDTGINQTYEGSTGATGGTTTFLAFSAAGGNGGGIGTAGSGGSNGSLHGAVAGENGTPGAGKIMSKFWSVEHNTEYGAAGININEDSWTKWGGGGGGYMDIGGQGLSDGRGYGGGGSGMGPSQSSSNPCQPYGHPGCLIIRIPI